MAYFACTGSAPAILAEALSAALNTNGLSWKSSPAIVELEQVALGWLRQWMGLPDDYFGIIYDTASVSTLHAITDSSPTWPIPTYAPTVRGPT